MARSSNCPQCMAFRVTPSHEWLNPNRAITESHPVFDMAIACRKPNHFGTPCDTLLAANVSSTWVTNSIRCRPSRIDQPHQYVRRLLLARTASGGKRLCAKQSMAGCLGRESISICIPKHLRAGIRAICRSRPELIAVVVPNTELAKPTKAKNKAAVALGKLGGKKGGPARAASLTPEKRAEIARKAANTRWKRAL